jgi:hypothetical protein
VGFGVDGGFEVVAGAADDVANEGVVVGAKVGDKATDAVFVGVSEFVPGIATHYGGLIGNSQGAADVSKVVAFGGGGQGVADPAPAIVVVFGELGLSHG